MASKNLQGLGMVVGVAAYFRPSESVALSCLESCLCEGLITGGNCPVLFLQQSVAQSLVWESWDPG